MERGLPLGICQRLPIWAMEGGRSTLGGAEHNTGPSLHSVARAGPGCRNQSRSRSAKGSSEEPSRWNRAGNRYVYVYIYIYIELEMVRECCNRMVSERELQDKNREKGTGDAS